MRKIRAVPSCLKRAPFALSWREVRAEHEPKSTVKLRAHQNGHAALALVTELPQQFQAPLPLRISVDQILKRAGHAIELLQMAGSTFFTRSTALTVSMSRWSRLRQHSAD